MIPFLGGGGGNSMFRVPSPCLQKPTMVIHILDEIIQ